MHSEKINELFRNITVTIPESKTDHYKNKRQFFLADIGDKW